MRLKRAVAAVICVVVLLLVGQVMAGPFAYSIPVQEDQLTIKADGMVELVRYFEFAVASSSSDKGTEIWAGLPTGTTQVQSVVDENGNKVKFSTRSSGGQYVVVLKDFNAIAPGGKLGFTVTAQIPSFLYVDQNNPDYATMEYTPAWWDQGDVGTQRVAIILPPKVTKEEIKTGQREWDGTAQTEDGRQTIYWEQKNMRAGQRLAVAVGFPSKYLNSGVLVSKPSAPTGGYNSEYRVPNMYAVRTGPNPLSFIIPFFVLFGIAAVVIGAASASGQQEYRRPGIAMEGVGVNRELDPVEAAVLLRKEPQQVLNMLMFKMLMENRVKLLSREPLQLEPIYTDGVKPHEKLFIEAIDLETKTLSEAKLADSFRTLVRSVVEKTKPYCRRDTERYYRGKVDEAWMKVRQAEAPDVKFKEYDANLLWLILNDEMQDKYGKEVEEVIVRQPRPVLAGWWFYPIYTNFYGGYGAFGPFGAFHHFYGNSGLVQNPARFKQIEQSLFVPMAPHSSGGSGGGGGRMTPPSCACACACVSCACACACAGGGGCT